MAAKLKWTDIRAGFWSGLDKYKPIGILVGINKTGLDPNNKFTESGLLREFNYAKLGGIVKPFVSLVYLSHRGEKLVLYRETHATLRSAKRFANSTSRGYSILLKSEGDPWKFLSLVRRHRSIVDMPRFYKDLIKEDQ